MDGVVKTAVQLSLLAGGYLLYEKGYLWVILLLIVSVFGLLMCVNVVWDYIVKLVKDGINDAIRMTPEEKKARREEMKAQRQQMITIISIAWNWIVKLINGALKMMNDILTIMPEEKKATQEKMIGKK